MRLIPYSPGVCHTIISIAALHLARRNARIDKDTEWPTQGTPTHCYSPYSPNQQWWLNMYHDSLFHKQKALIYLKNKSHEGFVHDYDGPIASILLFIWLEALESGKESWKYHLNGLRELVRQRKSLDNKEYATITNSNNPVLDVFSRSQEYFDTAYIVLVKSIPDIDNGTDLTASISLVLRWLKRSLISKTNLRTLHSWML